MNLSDHESVKGAFLKIMRFAGKRFLFSPSLPLPAPSISVALPHFSGQQTALNYGNASEKCLELRKRLLHRLITS